MQTKTVKRIIIKKLNEWLESIDDETLRKEVRENILVSGGSIASLFMNQPVNDYDIYIQNMDVLIRLAKYYVKDELVLDGRLKDKYLRQYFSDYDDSEFNINTRMNNLDSDLSEMAVRYKNLKPDQVRLDISAVGDRKQIVEGLKYQVVFLSPNAISLTDDIQIVLRFSGNAEEIHKNFDFIHATNYFTFADGLVTNIKALESLIAKDLKYQGSLYPLTSIIRIKKFLKRGWTINAGEMLKIMFQISELDLADVEVLEEQLIGVDIAYFSKLIDVLRGVNDEKMTSSYINEIIDRVFNDYEEPDNEIEE